MSENQAKSMFLRNRAYSLNLAVENLDHNHDAMIDHASRDFKDIANRLETCFREVKAIRAVVGDLADELREESC